MTDFERGAEAMRALALSRGALLQEQSADRDGIGRDILAAIRLLPLPEQQPSGSESREASERCTGHLVHDPHIFCPVHDA